MIRSSKSIVVDDTPSTSSTIFKGMMSRMNAKAGMGSGVDGGAEE
jgi:hypothetical protein